MTCIENFSFTESLRLPFFHNFQKLFYGIFSFTNKHGIYKTMIIFKSLLFNRSVQY